MDGELKCIWIQPAIVDQLLLLRKVVDLEQLEASETLWVDQWWSQSHGELSL